MEKKEHVGARCAVFVGPQGSGKTTLLEAAMRRAGALNGSGRFADLSEEAQDAGMSTEPNFARFTYLDEDWTAIDCPGSVELLQDSLNAMRAADIVIVVAEPDADRISSLFPYLKFLDDNNIPHALFINKIEESQVRIRELMEALQAASDRPLVLRQAPIRDGEKIIGAVDLVSERAWKYREGEPSELIELPESVRERSEEARQAMLDALADFDDALMEQILEDKTPPKESIFEHISHDIEQDLIVPVLIGSAVHGNGVTRLLKHLRHDAPGVASTAARFSLSDKDEQAALIVKTLHAQHSGKISVARVLRGSVKDGDTLGGARISGLLGLNGGDRLKIGEAKSGDLVGLPRIDSLQTNDLLTNAGAAHLDDGMPIAPVFARAIRARDEKADVKLSAALTKLMEEDPSLIAERREETRELVLKCQGDVHLRIASARLKNRFNIEIDADTPKAAYRETIRMPADKHARHKKQSGGHGQFADIKVKVKPQPRGAGFTFKEEIHGGSVPKQYIPAVEQGVVEGLRQGPLGFPVVDIAVTLYDGQHHAVDSSEMAFKIAGRLAMTEALPECDPVLLEPIYSVTIHAPSDATAKIHGVISGRRGQILGFDARPGWPGWDQVKAMMPETALDDLIIELRSLSQGAATYTAAFDHYQELYGRDADLVVNERKAAREH